MAKTTVTITLDAKTQAQLDAMSETIAEMVADVNNNAALVDAANATIATLERQLAYSEAANMELRRKLGETWLPVPLNEVPGNTMDRVVAAGLPDGYAVCRRVNPQPTPDVEFVPDEQPLLA